MRITFLTVTALTVTALPLALAASGCGGSAVDSRSGGEDSEIIGDGDTGDGEIIGDGDNGDGDTGDGEIIGDGDNGDVCSDDVVYGLSVTVIGVHDNPNVVQRLPSPEDPATVPCAAHVVVTDGGLTEIGDYRVTLECVAGSPRKNDCSCFGAPEKPGTYRVEARAAFTHPSEPLLVADVLEVAVGANDCHVNPQSVTVFGGSEEECAWRDEAREEALFAASSCTGGGSSPEDECQANSTVLDECGCDVLVNAQAPQLIAVAEEAQASWAYRCLPPLNCPDECPTPPPSLPTCGSDGRGGGQCTY